MSAPDHSAPDAIEQLVAQYLTSQAREVDGRAILERARETERKHVTRRRIAIVFAAAAAIIIIVTLGLVVIPGQPAAPNIPEVIQPITAGGSTLGSSFATARASFASIRQAVTERPEPAPAPAQNNLQPIVTEFRTTMKNDAAYMGGKLRTSISHVVSNAGLTL